MPVALVDFKAIYDGELETYTAGEWFDDRHEMVRKHPEKFGPSSPPRGKRRRDSVGTPPRSQAIPLARRRVEVQLSPAARQTILHGAFWQSGQDGHETGGWLIGGGLDTRAAVVDATLPGPNATRDRDYLARTYDGLETYKLKRLWGDPLAARIGSWHTHPGGDAEPSATDLESWCAGLYNVNRESWQPYYVGIIAAENARHGWDLNAWVAVKRGGETVIEPATIGGLNAALSPDTGSNPVCASLLRMALRFGSTMRSICVRRAAKARRVLPQVLPGIWTFVR
jgi:integrative and conjugative element protein (TIGR02256 family)